MLWLNLMDYAMSLIFISPWFRHLYQLVLSNKGAVTLSNSKGGFRGGPKGALVYSWQVGKCPSHPFLNFLDPPLADAGKMSWWEICSFLITYLETKNQFQCTAYNTKCTCTCMQCAKKVVSNSVGLVDFAIRLVNSVFNLPDGQVKNKRTVKSILLVKKFLGPQLKWPLG